MKMDKKAKKWGYSYYHPGYFRDMGDNGLTYKYDVKKAPML